MKRNPSDLNKKTFKQYNTIYNKLRRAAKVLYFDTQFKRYSKISKRRGQ